ncbi:MAG: hypothetical protein ACYCQJ_08845 [Nitrososphaerales archaeon]
MILVFTVDELVVVEFVKALVLLVDVLFVVVTLVVVELVVVDDCAAKTLKVRAPYATATTSREAMAIEPTIETIAFLDVRVLCLIVS